MHHVIQVLQYFLVFIIFDRGFGPVSQVNSAESYVGAMKNAKINIEVEV